MTKRTSQANTVVVPAVQANGAAAKGVAAATVAAAVAADAAAVKVEAKADEAPVTVVAEPVAALVAPAEMAMVAEPAAAATAQTDTTTTTDDDSGDDYTPYIVGGVLLAGGILAVALSSGDKDPIAPAPAPAPTPAPTNAVTISTPATATVAENTATNSATGPVVLDVNAAAAATGGAITYSLTGADASFFTINSSTGEIRLNNSANFEAKSTYNVTVTAASAANGTTPAASTTQAITITVTNVNETPTFTSATATATVVENAPAGVVFTAAATDPDANTTLVYSLGGTDAALFTINSGTGAVSLRNPADFETKPSYTFTVTASDAATGGLSATQTVTLNVTNVNEAPAFAVTTRTTTVAENSTGVLFTGGAADVDGTAAPNTLTYSITGADAAFFTVNPQTGAVSFVNSPNFEAARSPNYTFNLVATDQAGLTSTQTNTVTVTNVNEAPTVTVPTTAIAFAENQPVTTAVFTATAADPDAGSTLTYTLTGADAAAFAISPTGVVTFRASPDFEAVPTKTSYTVAVAVSDGAITTTSGPVTVNVTDVAEGPATVTVSLDAGGGNPLTVSGLGTAGVAQATIFTDNTTVASNATINNFGRDDIVRFSGTTTVSFSSIDNDLTIQFLNNGVLNDIKINDIVSPDAIITSEASAEAAVNAFFGTTGVDYFRFA